MFPRDWDDPCVKCADGSTTAGSTSVPIQVSSGMFQSPGFPGVSNTPAPSFNLPNPVASMLATGASEPLTDVGYFRLSSALQYFN